MSKKSYITDEDRNITHVRVTSDDGRESVLYKANVDFFGRVTTTEAIEKAIHKPDGTTEPYEAYSTLFGNVIGYRKKRVYPLLTSTLVRSILHTSRGVSHAQRAVRRDYPA